MNLQQRLCKAKKQCDYKEHLECKAIIDKHWPAIVAKVEETLPTGDTNFRTESIYLDFPEVNACSKTIAGHKYLVKKWYREGYYPKYNGSWMSPRTGIFYRLLKFIW